MAGVVLCSHSDSTAYGSGLRAFIKDRGFGTFENLQRERYSTMNDAGVGGPIVV